MVQHPPKRTPTPRELWRSFHRLVAPPSGPSPPLMHLSEGLAQRTVFARLHTGLPGEANLQGFSYNTDPTGEPTREIADAVGAPGLIQGKAQHQASSHGRRRLCLNVATGILPKNTILWSSWRVSQKLKTSGLLKALSVFSRHLKKNLLLCIT